MLTKRGGRRGGVGGGEGQWEFSQGRFSNYVTKGGGRGGSWSFNKQKLVNILAKEGGHLPAATLCCLQHQRFPFNPRRKRAGRNRLE